MFYELTTSLRITKTEGIFSFFKKTLRYFWYIFLAIFFVLKSKPKASSKKIVNFSFQAAGGLIAPYQVKSELMQLAELTKKINPKVVVEIGTFRGGTLFVFSRLAQPKASIISIDLIGGRDGGGYASWRALLFSTFISSGQKLHLLRGNSQSSKIISKVQSLIPKAGIDLLFIDGDHSYAGVKKDFENYSTMVKKGGFIVFHDICPHPAKLDCHVEKFWNKIKKGKKFVEFIENPEQDWGGIGVLFR